jgi:CHAD domain-containing protein
MARAREVPGFDCGEPLAPAAARVVEVRAAEVFEHAPGVLDLGDVERVHDMRVATRRLRAALEVFEPCFPRKPWREAVGRVKALADALGERRDCDVQIELLEGLVPELPAPDREAATALVGRLREDRLRANRELAPYVAAKRLRKLRRRLRRLVEAAER